VKSGFKEALKTLKFRQNPQQPFNRNKTTTPQAKYTTQNNNQARRRTMATLAFAVVYVAVGFLLIYWNFTGAISSTTFGIGIFVLIIASLILKFVTDFMSKRK
jgi:hypothetical protein